MRMGWQKPRAVEPTLGLYIWALRPDGQGIDLEESGEISPGLLFFISLSRTPGGVMLLGPMSLTLIPVAPPQGTQA